MTAAGALFLATAGLIVWQNAHVAVLWDLSYVLDSASRIASGQMPYRDFPFVHPPLTFLIQAAIIRTTGRTYFHHVIYTAVIGGFGTVLTWRIALASLRGRVVQARFVTLLLAAPLVFLGLYSIIPIPEYDGDCTFSMLVALWFLSRVDNTDSSPDPPWRRMAWGFIAGTALCIPLFFKQNMGLLFLVAAVFSVLALRIHLSLARRGSSESSPSNQALPAITLGAAATLLAAVLALHFTVGLDNYLYWTIRFAGQRRLPALSTMLGAYRDASLLWSIPCVFAGLALLRFDSQRFRWTRPAALALLSAPFVVTLASLCRYYDDPDSLGDSLLSLWPLILVLAAVVAIINLVDLRRRASIRAFFPLIILAAIQGTFMSQELWGSTYAIWPLIVLLISELFAALNRFPVHVPMPGWFTPALAALISATLLCCGAFYTISEERLSYINFPAGPVHHSTFPQLAGLSTPGPYLPELDEFLRYAQANIPQNDGLILIPGEDPFYFVTGRAPRFPVLLFDPTTDPYSPGEAADLVRARDVRWLVVKRDLQIKEDVTPNRDSIMQALMGEFTLAARLHGYDIYRR
jgi:hypothetical protein